MTGSRQLVSALCLFWGMHAAAYAQPKHGESRGESLYATHCSACHTAKIYWREQKLATGWNSLKVQVGRWQASIGLGWSEEEITEVARYLNAAHYHFPVTDQKGLLQGEKLNQALRQY